MPAKVEEPDEWSARLEMVAESAGRPEDLAPAAPDDAPRSARYAPAGSIARHWRPWQHGGQRRPEPAGAAAQGLRPLNEVLDRFSAPTRAWFNASFASPTTAQIGAWDAISNGQHTLVVAPTGSGKTLSAFLWAIDRLWAVPRSPQAPRCRVLYVSPLKALAVDVERNLRSPLVGIRHAAHRLGQPVDDVSVAIRSGDTPAAERRAFAKHGADVLITTPESLFLLLTSAARSALAGVETVIVDEVHAVAGTKRGAHLAVTLDRLDHVLERPAQRIGLSATVRPVQEVARYLAGGADVSTVQPPSEKQWDLQVSVPVADMTDPGFVEPHTANQPQATETDTGDVNGLGAAASAGHSTADDDFVTGAGPLLPGLNGEEDVWSPPPDPTERASIWPHVERRVVDLVADQSATLVFANSRRLAERLTSRLNDEWAERTDVELDAPAGPPAQVMAQSGSSSAAPPVLARAHHGSVSKEHRADIENALKSGELPAVVATSSLELGIDMGAVDLVVQIESPPSVASGLQRVGRAGHQVGAVSRGTFFPKHRGDLVQTAVVVDRMRAGQIEALSVLRNPLDVLAQQIVAMVAMDEWSIDEMFTLVRRSASYATLPRPLFEATLDMLAGRYPGEDFADLRPRVIWDRVAGTLAARPGAQLLAVTSGGTIPDRGLYAVMLATGDGPGRRVGELDEEMVYESRVGDVFTLGTSSWRIEDITRDQVLVTPAVGQIGRLPFWKGDAIGRPAELGQAVGAFVRDISGMTPSTATDALSSLGLDAFAARNLLSYLTEQSEETGQVPDDRTLLVERFRDEIGDWRVVVHSPYGTPVHAPWALCLAAKMRERYGADVQAMAADDGIVLRLPDVVDETDEDGRVSTFDADLVEMLTLDPDEIHNMVTAEIGGSALFAARFRECAGRALLLPRRSPGRRQPLWQQRQRSAQLLEVASRYPTFPVVLETVRECVQDVYDVDALQSLMKDIAARRVSVASIRTQQASPFARSLLMGYIAQFLYEGDSPLAERRAAALSLDPALLAELLGRGEGAQLRDLLDPEVVATTEQQLQRLSEDRACRNASDVVDLLRTLGPLSTTEITARVQPELRDQVAAWRADLHDRRQIIYVRVAGEERWADAQDAARLRDALGVALPVGVPSVFLEPVPDPLGDLVVRYVRTHTPFVIGDLANRLGVGTAIAAGAVQPLVDSGRIVRGALRPGGESGDVDDLCDADVLRMLRRRSLAALRQEVEPVTQDTFARFLVQWQSVGALHGVEGVHRAVEQLSGAPVPASALETLILPARVPDYAPAMLDELMSAGEVLWQGNGTLAGDDGWLSLHLADTSHLTLTLRDGPGHPPDAPDSADLAPDKAALVLGVLNSGGAYFFRALSESLPAEALLDDSTLLGVVWDLAWQGAITSDTIAPIRAMLSGGKGAHKSRRSSPRSVRGSGRGRPGATLDGLTTRSQLPTRPRMPSRSGPATGSGRWSLLPPVETDPTIRSLATAEQLLDRYGVVTRGSVVAEGIAGGYAGVYRVLAGAEEAGRVRRGYFVEHLGAAQFGTSGAVDRMRALSETDPTADSSQGHRPVREALRVGPSHGTGAWHETGTDRGAVVLAATDPANPYGASIAWPTQALATPDAQPKPGGDSAVNERAERSAITQHRPGRKAGALVTLLDGRLALYLERGGRTALTFCTAAEDCARVAEALAEVVRARGVAALTVQKIDGEAALSSDHPLAQALVTAGFHTAPHGLRLRR
ncbi:MAG: DEAD/DEAH box helicase [Ornithinimicrobium sp.]